MDQQSPESDRGRSVTDSPPHNLEAECAVLGACLINPDAYDLAAGILTDADWHRGHHRTIWRALTALRQRGVVLDLVTLKAEMSATKLADVGGPAYVASLTDGLPKSTNVAHYAALVAGCAARRTLQAAAGTASPDTLRAAVERLGDLAAGATGDAGMEPFVPLSAVDAAADLPPAPLTGLAWSGKLAILAGAPKAGKSTILGQAIGAMATGASFLSESSPAFGGRVAIVTEEPLGTVKTRLEGYGVPDSDLCHLASPAAGPARLLAALKRSDDSGPGGDRHVHRLRGGGRGGNPERRGRHAPRHAVATGRVRGRPCGSGGSPSAEVGRAACGLARPCRGRGHDRPLRPGEAGSGRTRRPGTLRRGGIRLAASDLPRAVGRAHAETCVQESALRTGAP